MEPDHSAGRAVGGDLDRGLDHAVALAVVGLLGGGDQGLGLVALGLERGPRVVVAGLSRVVDLLGRRQARHRAE